MRTIDNDTSCLIRKVCNSGFWFAWSAICVALHIQPGATEQLLQYSICRTLVKGSRQFQVQSAARNWIVTWSCSNPASLVLICGFVIRALYPLTVIKTRLMVLPDRHQGMSGALQMAREVYVCGCVCICVCGVPSSRQKNMSDLAPRTLFCDSKIHSLMRSWNLNSGHVQTNGQWLTRPEIQCAGSRICIRNILCISTRSVTDSALLRLLLFHIL